MSFDSKARISPLSLHPISTLLVLPPVKFLLTTHTHPVSVAPAVSFRESKGLALPSPQTDPLLPAPWVSPCCMKTGGRGRHGKGASRIVFGMLGKCGSCEFKYRSSLSLLFFFFLTDEHLAKFCLFCYHCQGERGYLVPKLPCTWGNFSVGQISSTTPGTESVLDKYTSFG